MKNINKNNILTCFYLSWNQYSDHYFSANTYLIQNNFITKLKVYSYDKQIEYAEFLKVISEGDNKSKAIIASMARYVNGYVLVFDINEKEFIFLKKLFKKLEMTFQDLLMLNTSKVLKKLFYIISI